MRDVVTDVFIVLEAKTVEPCGSGGDRGGVRLEGTEELAKITG